MENTLEKTQAERQTTLTDSVQGRVVYLLALVIVVQTLYPFTVDGSFGSLIIYQILYGCLMFAGILIARETPTYTRILAVLGIVWIITGVFYALNQQELWALLAGYFVLIAFLSMVIKVLLTYILITKSVNRDVIYAAVCIYFLMGAFFVPIYGLIDTVQLHYIDGLNAFSDGTFTPVEGELTAFPWQNLIYYSYSTLTTLGYGDVLPISPWARSAASFQSMVGVLYLTIIMARLVGVFTAAEAEKDQEAK